MRVAIYTTSTTTRAKPAPRSRLRNAEVFARAGAPCRAQVGSLSERLGRAVAIGAPLRPDKLGRRLVRLCPVSERSLASLKPSEGVARRLLHRRPQHRGSPVSQTNRDGSGTKRAMSRLEFAQTRSQRRRQKAALARRRVWRAARKAARREAHAERWPRDPPAFGQGQLNRRVPPRAPLAARHAAAPQAQR